MQRVACYTKAACEVCTQVWLANAEYPIYASDDESPLAPLGMGETDMLYGHLHHGGVLSYRVHSAARIVEYRITHLQSR